MTNDQHQRDDRSSMTDLDNCSLLNVIGIERKLKHPLLRARNHAVDESNFCLSGLDNRHQFFGAHLIAGNHLIDFLQHFFEVININTTAVILKIRVVVAHEQARASAGRFGRPLNQTKHTADCGALCFKIAQLLLQPGNLSTPAFHFGSRQLAKPGQVDGLKIPRRLSSPLHSVSPFWLMSPTGAGFRAISQPLPRSDLFRDVRE